MDQQSPLQAAMQLHGADAMGIAAGMMLRNLYNAMPDPPVSPSALLASAVAARAPTDGADRISGLPEDILKSIVSRLPAKSAVRTGELASRWRGIWRSVPLVLADSDVFPDDLNLMPKRMTREDYVSRAAVVDVASALAAHPGPVRCFHLTSVTWSRVASHQAEIARWLGILAAKGVQELVLINRPSPFDLPLPAALFSCTALTCLHVTSRLLEAGPAYNLAALYDLNTSPQTNTFLRILSSLMRTREELPGRSPIPKLLQTKHA